jgi:hypothetical protein
MSDFDLIIKNNPELKEVIKEYQKLTSSFDDIGKIIRSFSYYSHNTKQLPDTDITSIDEKLNSSYKITQEFENLPLHKRDTAGDFYPKIRDLNDELKKLHSQILKINSFNFILSQQSIENINQSEIEREKFKKEVDEKLVEIEKKNETANKILTDSIVEKWSEEYEKEAEKLFKVGWLWIVLIVILAGFLIGFSFCQIYSTDLGNLKSQIDNNNVFIVLFI